MEKELLEQFDVSLCEFSSDEWPRNGFIDPINRVVYINGDLSPRNTFEGYSARIRALRT
ncbi:hypothetical protein [Streptococcus salivarius]|uniref:hypothetical protein n=1 Tax=Streptococcus salivarius TaxID=1304 RepID=UPI002000F92A|nr:hypothetical protein [Streptococcus salivarius]